MTTDNSNVCLLSLFCYEKALKCMLDFKHIQGNQNTCLLPWLPLQLAAVFPLAHVKAKNEL